MVSELDMTELTHALYQMIQVTGSPGALKLCESSCLLALKELFSLSQEFIYTDLTILP